MLMKKLQNILRYYYDIKKQSTAEIMDKEIIKRCKYIFEIYSGRIIFEVRSKNIKAIYFSNKVIESNNVKKHIESEFKHDDID